MKVIAKITETSYHGEYLCVVSKAELEKIQGKNIEGAGVGIGVEISVSDRWERVNNFESAQRTVKDVCDKLIKLAEQLKPVESSVTLPRIIAKE